MLKLKDGTLFENAQCAHGGNVLSCRISQCSIYYAAQVFTEDNCSRLTIVDEGLEDETIEGYNLQTISVDGSDSNGVSVLLKGIR